jgi:outer membrane immunogenic protein
MRVKFATLLASALSLATAQVALAADIPVKGPIARAPIAGPGPNWTSCYVGGHAGYSWSRWTDNSLPGAVASDLNPIASEGDPIVFGYDGKYNSDGFAGGGQFGCDKQYGQFVLGAVIDVTWTDQKEDSAPFQITPVDPTTSAPEVATVDLRYFGTARARLGFLPTPTALVYATGGLAWARASMSVRGEVFNPATVSFSVSDTTNFVGWTAGAGFEWMFLPNWTVGVEYLHLDFGDANFRFGTSFPNVTTTEALAPGVNVSLTSDIVRGTVNFRF